MEQVVFLAVVRVTHASYTIIHVAYIEVSIRQMAQRIRNKSPNKQQHKKRRIYKRQYGTKYSSLSNGLVTPECQ